MRLILGLGNPLSDMQANRHNLGRMMANFYARHLKGVTDDNQPAVFATIALDVPNGDNGRDNALSRSMHPDLPASEIEDIPQTRYADIMIENEVMILQPYTFMNQTGRVLKAAVDFTGISLKDVLIICDDVSLPFGAMRIRQRGSAGGHNGLKDIFNELGTEEITRLKIGCNKPSGDLYKHVLSDITEEERMLLPYLAKVVCKGIDLWRSNEYDKTTAYFNSISKNGADCNV